MQIVALAETSGPEMTDALRRVMMHRTVVDCGVATFPPGTVAHAGERHTHPHDELFVILSGEITIPTEGGHDGVARAGDWLVVQAGVDHHLTNRSEVPCTAMYLLLKAGDP